MSQHADTRETRPDVAKDGVSLTPCVIELDEVDVQLEVVFEPRQRFLLARICLLRVERSTGEDGAIKEGVGGLSETDNTVSETKPVLVRVTIKRDGIT